jgi:hypothetical protein
MEGKPKSLPRPWSPSTAVSRADRPVRLKPQRPRFDPSSPGLLSRLPDDGDGMDQARPTPARGAPRPENNTLNKLICHS